MSNQRMSHPMKLRTPGKVTQADVLDHYYGAVGTPERLANADKIAKLQQKLARFKERAREFNNIAGVNWKNH
jgi:hypothetical protein